MPFNLLLNDMRPSTRQLGAMIKSQFAKRLPINHPEQQRHALVSSIPNSFPLIDLTCSLYPLQVSMLEGWGKRKGECYCSYDGNIPFNIVVYDMRPAIRQ